MKERYRLIGNMLSSHQFTKLVRNQIHRNFRPISALTVFSKILERAVHCMVYSYLQEHSLLSPLQSGFRPLPSTCTCLTHLTNTLLENIDKGLLTGLIFLDLSKAFDTLDHSIMLDTLTSLGMNHSTVQWFRSYLTMHTYLTYLTMHTQTVCPSLYLSGSPRVTYLALYYLHFVSST